MTDQNYQADYVTEVHDHDPALYQAKAIAPLDCRADGLSDEHIDLYRQRGFLVVDGLFTSQEIDSYIQGLTDLIQGKMPDYPGLQPENAALGNWDKLAPAERENVLRKMCEFEKYEPHLKELVSHPALLGICRRLLGAEPKLFQTMALLKPPRIGREKPWHQDHAYFKVPLEDPICGCWIALDEATIENGCMHIMPARPRLDPLRHAYVRDWQVCDKDMIGLDSTAVPMKPGQTLFFSSLLPHGTPKNTSDQRRWAIQLHYAASNHGELDPEIHGAVFGKSEDDVEC